MRYWLMKSEPEAYGIEDLARDRRTIWDGVRNYQARNFLKEAEVGDRVFFYHSNAKPPGIAGLMTVVAAMVPDPTQFDESSKYYDAKSTPEKPRWHTVEVEFVQQFAELIPLDTLRETFTPDELLVVKRGTRLSVIPVDEVVAERILAITAE